MQLRKKTWRDRDYENTIAYIHRLPRYQRQAGFLCMYVTQSKQKKTLLLELKGGSWSCVNKSSFTYIVHFFRVRFFFSLIEAKVEALSFVFSSSNIRTLNVFSMDPCFYTSTD
jgi:hypothetical protein